MFRARGMIVGCAGAGKTTLLENLKRVKRNNEFEKTETTVGLEVHEDLFEIIDDKLMDFSTNEDGLPIRGIQYESSHGKKLISMTDFAGQVAYYACHQVYLSKRAFYLIVIDMSKELKEKVCKHNVDRHNPKGSLFHAWKYKECDIGFYGTNCTNRCLNCLNSACNAGNGICIQGCEDGYMGQRCEQTCITGRFGRNCSSVCNRNCRLKSCENTQGGCTNGCEPGWEGFNCSEEALNLKIADSRITDADKGVLAGSLATSIIFIGAVTITIIIIIRRRRNTKERYTANQQQGSGSLNLNGFEENEIDGFDNPVYITNSLEKTHSPRHNTLKIFELQAIIESMPVSENVSFKSEYEKIPKGELYPCTEWKKVENVPKNRFLSALPYDHSRVILKKSCPGESDYINANYVKDVQGQKAYIATQGPKPKTFTDFWRMVSQENVSIIVCLTNLKDGIKAKCALYWPNANSRIQNGYLSVQHRDEKVYANYIVRRFWIQNISNNSKRDVIMFHFTQWPVHGAPEPLSLVIFHRHVMKMSRIYRGKYTLVHCSAGIGRTGIYIALDALYRQAEETGEIDVPHYLESMRKDRMNMMQGERPILPVPDHSVPRSDHKCFLCLME
ncbi:receptor-type tyrosine-protein phosphatase delta-like [Saccostrea cucullata]|uniref:receptor-type tyrosine-protein phosphatase delta-like n=1 Tax=Saccostrea cuccullata TaxID=36930 RepID=UPI002ED0DE5A